jgi:hypothetical protein
MPHEPALRCPAVFADARDDDAIKDVAILRITAIEGFERVMVDGA